MATAHKRGDKWRIFAYRNNERKTFTADTKAEAEKLAAAWVQEIKAQEKDGPTIAEAAETYITNRSAVLSPKTVKENKSILKYLPESVGEMSITNIDTEILQKWVNRMAKTKSPKTVRNKYGFVAAVIRHNTGTAPKITLPMIQKKEIQIPSTEEVQILLENTEGDMHTAILVSSSCGLRRSELLAISNDRETFAKGILTVKNAVVENEDGALVMKTTKTYDSQRKIKLPGPVKRYLLSLPEDKKYICELSPHNLSQGFNRLSIKLLGKSYTFHNLRHYYCSVLIAEGVPELYAMKMMGHSTPNMIREVYGHIMADRQDDINSRLDDFFEKSTP